MVRQARLSGWGYCARQIWRVRNNPTLSFLVRASRLHRAFAFGAGFSIVVAIAALLVVPREDRLENAIVSSHLRAEQPGHPMVGTVQGPGAAREWFSGKLQFTPPIHDVAGYQITGTRLDFVAGRFVAVILYRAPEGVIDLYVWPDATESRSPRSTSTGGRALRYWSDGGLQFWVIAQVPAARIENFVQIFRAAKS